MRRTSFRRASVGMALIGGLTSAMSCQLWRSPPPIQPPPTAPSDIATDVTVAATPEYRLLVTRYDPPSQSRLIAFLTRLDNVGGETFRFTPANASIVLPDGTRLPALDRLRANALLQRVTFALHDGAESGLTPEVPDLVRGQVGQTLLDERDLTSDETLLGYVVVDTRQPLSSLDGTRFEVRLTRASDGAILRQEHPFGNPPAEPSPPPTP